MTRKKVKLAFIVNDSSRKATYKKRKKGLLKKVDELSTLCGIEACAIIYSPFDSQPEVWPSPWGVQRVLSKFRTMPELEQSKKMMNQESFMKQRIMKAKEQVKKQRKENKEKEMTLFMFQCLAAGKIVPNNMTMVDFNDLGWLIDQNLKDIGKRLETLNENANAHIVATPSQVQMAPPPLAGAKNEGNGLGMNVETMQLQRQWFMDLMMNGNGNETMQFGDPNLQLGFWPNPQP